MDKVRVRFDRGVPTWDEQGENSSATVGFITSEETWSKMLLSVPKRPVATYIKVTAESDSKFQVAVDVRTLLGYKLSEAARWLNRLARPATV